MQKAINNARRDALLHYVSRDMGFACIDALLQSAMSDELCAAVCIECHTLYSRLDRFAYRTHCECCYEPTVQSVLVVADILPAP